MSSDDVQVLLVDDAGDFDFLVDVFRKRGWHATLDIDGAAAIRDLERKDYDAVILDRNMPGRSGDAVLQWIHEELVGVRPCVIMLTGHANTDSAAAAVEHDAYRYLSKPVEPDVLIRILRTGIALRRCQRMIRDLRTAPSVEEMFEQSRRVLTLACQPDAASVVFVDKTGKVRKIYGHITGGPKTDVLRFVNRVLSGNGQRLYLKTKRELEDMDSMLQDAGSLLAVPVPDDEGYQGVLAIESVKEHAFDAHWTDLLRQLAELVGLAASISEWSTFKSAAMLYSEFRHSTATHAQVIAMQADRMQEVDLPRIADQKLSQDVQKRLSSIVDHAAAIETVVEDLRAASAELPLTVDKNEDLAAIVTDAVQKARDECANETPLIDIALTGCDAPIVVKGDSMWLGYALSCVLTNAREAIVTERETRHKAIRDEISVKVTRSDGLATITIQDSGIGIPKKSLDLIFRPLFSTKTRTAAQPAGQLPEFASRFLSGLTRAMIQYPELRKLPDTAILSLAKGSTESEDVLIVRRDTIAHEQRFVVHLVEFSKKRGIGLYTARRVIHRHGGGIQAFSAGFHHGAMFTISLQTD